MAEGGSDKLKTRHRYGIGEWYGKSLVRLTPEERKHFANIQKVGETAAEPPRCPFRGSPGEKIPCTKKGGVCSIRFYEQHVSSGVVSLPSRQTGSLVTTCPYRFEQEGTILKWVGETLLGHPQPQVVEQVGFLEQGQGNNRRRESGPGPKFVGRIDKVLVHPTREPMQWCALEIQAVYFSGHTMTKEFDMLRRISSERLPFPATNHRPDFRSSGPKRLMPQLQIKVPTLRRWGKKMAVVVDRNFFDALGKMDDVKDVPSCDIAWFVVRYEENEGDAVLARDFARLTTLERAVEGLTGGDPVTLEVFEARIREKLGQN
jgi:hypothetical protein